MQYVRICAFITPNIYGILSNRFLSNFIVKFRNTYNAYKNKYI